MTFYSINSILQLLKLSLFSTKKIIMLGGIRIEAKLETNLKCSNSACYGLLTNRQSDKEPSKFEQKYGLMCDDCNDLLSQKHSAIVECEKCGSLTSIEIIPNQTTFMYYVNKCSKCGGTLNDEKTIYPPNFLNKKQKPKWQNLLKGLPLLRNLLLKFQRQTKS